MYHFFLENVDKVLKERKPGATEHFYDISHTKDSDPKGPHKPTMDPTHLQWTPQTYNKPHKTLPPSEKAFINCNI